MKPRGTPYGGWPQNMLTGVDLPIGRPLATCGSCEHVKNFGCNFESRHCYQHGQGVFEGACKADVMTHWVFHLYAVAQSTAFSQSLLRPRSCDARASHTRHGFGRVTEVHHAGTDGGETEHPAKHSLAMCRDASGDFAYRKASDQIKWTVRSLVG